MPELSDITKARAEARKLFAHGSARAVYSWVLEHGLTLLDEADENDRIIQTLRRQRDESEAALERVRVVVESDHWGTYWGQVMVPQDRLRAALDGDQ